MLTVEVLAFAAALTGAAATEEAITGAFGLEFGQPLPPSTLGASVAFDSVPYPEPPANLEQTLPDAPADHGSGWYLFQPSAKPELLNHPGARFFVLRGYQDEPLRILAEHPEPRCIDDMLWLTGSLAKKYGADGDPFGAARAGFRQSARFVNGATQVDVSCGPRLLIEYTDGAAYADWLGERADRQAARAAEQAALAEQRALVETERLRLLADSFTAGDRFRLLGAFGIPFGEPVDPAWLESGFLVDEPLAVRPPRLPEPFAAARFEVTLGPDRIPIRIASEVPGVDEDGFARLAGALETKYGPPLKSLPRHRIHKVRGDYLVARYEPGAATARLVFIDDVARDAQKAREAAAHAQRLAEQRAQFEEETAGL